MDNGLYSIVERKENARYQLLGLGIIARQGQRAFSNDTSPPNLKKAGKVGYEATIKSDGIVLIEENLPITII